MATVPVPDELVKQDNLLDLSYLDRSLEILFDQMDSNTENSKYDLRRKIDRHTIPSANPMFLLHAIGKVTAANVAEGKSGFEQSTKAEENRAWGTGFMISPCHMITNNHVVCEKELINGRSVCIRNESLKGKSINFSFGENSEGTDFEKRVTGNVIASDEGLDYALIRIDSLKDFKREQPQALWNEGQVDW
jgi:S1-C subfamily serine protease